MILVENRNILRMKNQELLNRIVEIEKEEKMENVIVEPSKRGNLTLKILDHNKTQYLISKYDPIMDAERMVNGLIELTAKHVLFIGVGLGYHIEEFAQRYPTTKFFVYEPNEEVLLAYLSHSKLSNLPLQNLLGIFTGTSENIIDSELRKILKISDQALKVIVLPAYEKIYPEQITKVMDIVVNAMKGKRTFIQVETAFQTRWTANAIKNFPVILQTPNILHDIDKEVFSGKPAIIVAAGPSLNEEFENLRYIKENGLAYIFSIGSAINALLDHGIHPDAAYTYDPQGINAKVIQIIKDQEITNIPLIFGSSVGFETLENYPGKMLHMLVSQDTITPAFIGEELVTELKYVNDAASVAIVAYQVLSQLNCAEIILVGQNLAYVGQEHYAKGINYGKRINVSKDTLENALETKDVYGNTVKTTEFFNRMRNQLETYIKSHPNIKTINATKGGAAIDGALFIPLEEIIEKHLKSRVVIDGWYDVQNSYDSELVFKNLEKMNKEQEVLEELLKQAMKTLKLLNERIEKRLFTSIEVLYSKFDIEFERIKENYFYRSFIEQMIRVQNKQVSKKIKEVRHERNAFLKGKVVVDTFHAFLHGITSYYYFTTALYEEMKERINYE